MTEQEIIDFVVERLQKIITDPEVAAAVKVHAIQVLLDLDTKKD